MRQIYEDEMSDYLEQAAQERWARKKGYICTCLYRPLDSCPVHDPIPDREEDDKE
jgi:hypothetical protein